MASSGKKGKKSKGKTLALTDFLQESTSGTPTSVPVKKYPNWSDEVEDAFDTGYESRAKATPVVLPTAPRAARGPDISDDRIPTQAPFIAYISNLPYDVDEDDIADFFANMQISNMRLPRDDRGGESGKLKGFGYVEFENRTSLIDAISIIDTNLKGRRIKIDVATSSDGDRRRGGRMEMGRDRAERPEVTMSDWRSGPRSDPAPESRGGGGGGGGFRDRERDREAPSDNNRPGAWRDSNDRPSFRDSNRDRGFSRDSERDRGGFRDREGFSDRGRFSDRDGDRRGGGFGPRRYGDREGTDRETDGEMRRRDDGEIRRRDDGEMRRRDDGEMRRRDDGEMRRRDDGPVGEKEQPRSRPKLMLAPRTKPLEEQATVEAPEEKEVTTVPVPAVSIFGAAKPVDTSARERQIEERLAKEKESQPPSQENSGSRDKSREPDEEKPKKEVWGRRRNDDHDDNRKESPDRRPASRGPRRNDDKKPGVGSRDKALPKKDDRSSKKEDRHQRDNHEREMPKLKEPEPPNFAASNIFATLEPDANLDN